VVLQHVAHEGPGAIADALHAGGHNFLLVRVDEGGTVPGIDEVAGIKGLVVMGGPMGVHDDAEYPWLVAERALMSAAVLARIPVLGVCLGAQQLAAALGGMVMPGPEAEIGAGEVVLTRQAAEDPVFGPVATPLPCFHWHGDTFSLPPGSELMAWNETYLHQAFRYGEAAYGLQFHVELTPDLAEHWRPHLPTGVSITEHAARRINKQGALIVERFIALANEASE
jgi:GMP synthase (glutamine-hydrolysing)